MGSYLFILPSLLGFLVFVFLAVGCLPGHQFPGLGTDGTPGFRRPAITTARLLRDPVFWTACTQHGFLHRHHRAAAVGAGSAMAVALNQAIRGLDVFRLIYFLPVVTTIVAGAIVFRLLLSHNGPLADLAGALGSLLGLPFRLPDLLGQHHLLQMVGGHPDPLEEHRLHHGRLPGRAAGRASGAVRRGSTSTAPTPGSVSATSACR